jgi:hypothetical protein
MGLFGTKAKHASVVLIDIDSSSVGGALAHLATGEPPITYFTVRQQIEAKEHEDTSEAMLRTLTELANRLVTSGAPILRQETGSGHIDRIFVSVGAPWQKTKIRIEAISETKPFVFTQAILAEITKKGEEIPVGYIKSDESVVATLLNGYETAKPFGKRATRADMIILSSLLDEKVAKEIEKSLRKTYHTHALTLTTFASVSYAAFRDIYPHEKDFLLLQVSGEATDIAFVKRGFLVDVASIPHGINDLVRGSVSEGGEKQEPLVDLGLARQANRESVLASTPPLIDPNRNARFSARIEGAEKEWLQFIETSLQDASARHALPRTLFLLADENAREYLKRLLNSSSMRSLWLTDDPLRVISVVPAHFAQFVKSRGNAEGDVFLALLALFSKKSL